MQKSLILIDQGTDPDILNKCITIDSYTHNTETVTKAINILNIESRILQQQNPFLKLSKIKTIKYPFLRFW